MREILTTLIGQSGIQIGNSFWNLIRNEHGIDTDGQLIDDNNNNMNGLLNIMFNKTSHENYYVPRTIMIDNDCLVIDRMLQYSNFSPQMTVYDKDESGGLFSRAFYALSKKIIPPTLDLIRRSVENCDNLEAFLMFSSLMGGTGSGLTAKLIEESKSLFNGSKILELNVFPSPSLSTMTVEPYNAVFRAHHSLNQSHCMFQFDNEACYDILRRSSSIQHSTIKDVNKLISLVASSITSSTRFGGSLNIDISDFETNLVPFPKIHFPTATYAPIINGSSMIDNNRSINYLTEFCFDNKNRMIKFIDSSSTMKLKYHPIDRKNYEHGKYMACCLLYRGDCQLNQVNKIMQKIKENKKDCFFDWSPGIKCGISNQIPIFINNDDNKITEINRSLCLLSNETNMIKCWRLLLKKFDVMYRKRAFVHWYVDEYMEESEFNEARENIECLIDDYLEIDCGKKINKFCQ